MFTSHWLATRDDDLWSPLVETIYDVNTTELSTHQNDKPITHNTVYISLYTLFEPSSKETNKSFSWGLNLNVKRDQKRFNTGRTDEGVSQIISRDFSLTTNYPKTLLKLYVPDLQMLRPTWNFFGVKVKIVLIRYFSWSVKRLTIYTTLNLD